MQLTISTEEVGNESISLSFHEMEPGSGKYVYVSCIFQTIGDYSEVSFYAVETIQGWVPQLPIPAWLEAELTASFEGAVKTWYTYEPKGYHHLDFEIPHKETPQTFTWGKYTWTVPANNGML